MAEKNFEVYSDNRRDLVTFVTDNIGEEFLSLKEKEQQVNRGYKKLGPIPSINPNKENGNKWIIIYERKR